MQFLDDFIVSWDFSDKDFPAVSITHLHSNEKSTMLIADVLDVKHDNCGVVSVRQLLNEFDREKRERELTTNEPDKSN